MGAIIPFGGVVVEEDEAMLSGMYIAYDSDGRPVGYGHLNHGYQRTNPIATVAQFKMGKRAYAEFKAATSDLKAPRHD